MKQSLEREATTVDGWCRRWMRFLFTPVDGASVVVFRIGFGLVMVWLGIDYLVAGRAYELYVKPDFHFTYYGFDWVQPFSLNGMKLFFVAMSVLGLFVAGGLLYRVTTPSLALLFTYFLLLDRTNYQNHYYLLMLLGWLMVFIPAHRLWSIDSILWPSLRSESIAAWSVWLLRFHVGLPYFFGGVAKLNHDWFAGAPLRQMLASRSDLPFIGPWLTLESVVQVFIWGGALFDLLVVPLLIWKRTRSLAYLICLAFHLINSMVFDSIHVFPWFMIVATTIFFSPDWPRPSLDRLLKIGRGLRGNPEISAESALNEVPVSRLEMGVRPAEATLNQAHSAEDPCAWMFRRRFAAMGFAGLCCLFHLAWPLVHFLEEGDTSWTERGHHFSWRMMLRGKTSGFRYLVTDPQTGLSWNPDVRKWITPDQEIRFVRDPEMILHLAHFISEDYLKLTGREFEVRALVLTSLNGRKPQLLIDPTVDLSKEPRGYYQRSWIRPLTEPLRKDPWMIPPSQWERLIDVKEVGRK